MVPVVLSEEPHDFEVRVRSRGSLFLASATYPITNRHWRKAAYWSSAHDYLYADHKGICMYCSSWTPRSTPNPTEGTSIDHFISRSEDPTQAYEWTNFRLARKRLNGLKQDHTDVIDPVIVPKHAFRLDFVRNRLHASPELKEETRRLIISTIQRLRLNSDTFYLDERFEVYSQYAQGKFGWDEVELRFPFIASEMQRQNFDQTYKHLFT